MVLVVQHDVWSSRLPEAHHAADSYFLRRDLMDPERGVKPRPLHSQPERLLDPTERTHYLGDRATIKVLL